MFLRKINKKNRFILFISFFPFFILFSSSIQAHEMWIEALDFSIEVGEKMMLHEMVGQDFKGNKYAYLDHSFEKIELISNGKKQTINPRLGDLPAIQYKSKESTLHIITAETTPSELTYETFEQFEDFVKGEGLEWVLTEHEKRGLADKGFKEIYRRNAKALIKVGNGNGNDEAQGLPFEWVALTNPYESSKQVTLQLFWQGKPAINMNVHVFNRTRKGNKSIKKHLRTDQNGQVMIPKAEGGLFLINSVKMIPINNKLQNETDAVWESIWASLTYAVE